MLSFIRPEDNIWDVPVVLFCVWTVVLVVATLIVLSCLQRETKKFKKRLSKADSKEDLVRDIAKLDNIMARYVQQFLGQGILEKLANSYANDQEESKIEALRAEAQQWFATKVQELSGMKMTEKAVKQAILSAIRTGLTKHPLDLRGSRRALEAAKIFLEIDGKKEKFSFLDTSLIIPKTSPADDSSTLVCPTVACQWMTSKFLKLLSLFVSHPNTIPLLFVFFSFVVWLYDCVTDMVIIELLWNFRLPIMYPVNESFIGEEVTYLSYQTLTIDLYAPLLLLILLFSLIFTLLSCSCSRLSDRYRLATMYAKPLYELSGQNTQDPTTILARYDFQVSQAVTASLPQFCLQFGSYMVILYMLETLKGLSVDKATQDTVQEKIDSFAFSSLWFSGLGSALSLIVAQYTAVKIQHEHDLTLGQRIIYFVSCIFNTIAMMTSSVIFITVIILPVSTYVGRYHIMILVILFAAILGLGTLISLTLAFFGLDPTTITTDRVVTRFQTNNLLTAFLRFSQVGSGQWASLLGAATLVGKIFSLITINLFLPPSQLLLHPFCKFYSTSPRSPALHYAIAKQLIYYNILLITSSILLCVDINEYGFNYNITPATKNLLIYANITCVPCIFMALLLLFKFYSSFDIWTSHGVHIVFHQDLPTIIHSPETGLDADEDEDASCNQTNVTLMNYEEDSNAKEELFEDEAPIAESTVIANGETTLTEEQNESTEADRSQLTKKKRKIQIIKHTTKLNKKMKNSCCSCVTDVAVVDVRGRWVNVSD
eukprot:TRINITY_DN4096_c0_g1_i7.p1 TRINITY_DN4096_c0_g1~~TRINITY_DN4096_c0_g1_i7.p1  ORF type:complete len:770 (-),score=237.96 TRINITY_DN4096_c0_g1_i7:508-2817(-)